MSIESSSLLWSSCLHPDMGAGARALFSTRVGGVSVSPFDSLNLGDHVRDVPEAVQRNRRAVEAALRVPAVWLNQVHGARVVRLRAGDEHAPTIEADGAITDEPGVACAVMVADCLPLLMAAPDGRAVGALHAGWRGLAGAGALAGRGVVEQGVWALCELASCDPADLKVWLGPCIGPQAFEVGADVLEAFGVASPACDEPLAACFQPVHVSAQDHHATYPSDHRHAPPRWMADLQALARLRLAALGVRAVHASALCTASDPRRFFSFRRDGLTGRMAALIVRDRL